MPLDYTCSVERILLQEGMKIYDSGKACHRLSQGLKRYGMAAVNHLSADTFMAGPP